MVCPPGPSERTCGFAPHWPAQENVFLLHGLQDLWCSPSAETSLALSHGSLTLSYGDFLFTMPLDLHNCVLYLEAVTLLQFSLQLPLKETCICLLFPRLVYF